MPVEVQNYIDDTGVQVADVVGGFLHLEHHTPDEVRRIADEGRFDYYCRDLYAKVTEWYEADKTRLALRSAALHDIEHGTGEAAVLGAFIADRIVRCHLETMHRLNVDYDLLTWEGDILRLHFWSTAFDILKSNGSVYLQHEGRLAGCWVMQIDEEAGLAGGADPEASDESEGEAPAMGQVIADRIVRCHLATMARMHVDYDLLTWEGDILRLQFVTPACTSISMASASPPFP